MEHLAAFEKLTNLHLGNDQLKNADMEVIGKLKGLKKLGLFAPDITDKGTAHFKGLTKLESIDLRGTGVTSATGATLRAAPGLKMAKVNVMPFDAKHKARIVEWKKQLPRTTIQPIVQSFGFGGFIGGGGGAPGGAGLIGGGGAGFVGGGPG